MSEVNVEILRKGVEAFNRRDFETALALLRDDVTWERFLSRTEAENPAVQGKDELRTIWESQVEAVDIRVEPQDFIAAGEDKVIMPGLMVAHGTGSEITLSTPLTWVWTFGEDGLVSKVEAFESRAEALGAAGLG